MVVFERTSHAWRWSDMEEKIYIKPPPQQASTSTLNDPAGKGEGDDNIGERPYKRLYQTWKGGNVCIQIRVIFQNPKTK